MITAAALISDPGHAGAAALGLSRRLVALIVAQFVHTHFVIKPDDYDHLNPVNKATRRSTASGSWGRR